MEITSTPLEWTSDDALNFRAFLKTQSGSRLLPKAAESTPALLPEGDINRILIRSGEVRGFQAVIQTLLSLAYPTAEPENTAGNTNYPDLTDDRSWDDGNKIETATPSPYGLSLNTQA